MHQQAPRSCVVPRSHGKPEVALHATGAAQLLPMIHRLSVYSALDRDSAWLICAERLGASALLLSQAGHQTLCHPLASKWYNSMDQTTQSGNIRKLSFTEQDIHTAPACASPCTAGVAPVGNRLTPCSNRTLIRSSSHVLVSVPPDIEGLCDQVCSFLGVLNPSHSFRDVELVATTPGASVQVLPVHAEDIIQGNCTWLGYLSSTAVYGDWQGQEVDEEYALRNAIPPSAAMHTLGCN